MKDWKCTLGRGRGVVDGRFFTSARAAKSFGVPVDTMEVGDTFIDAEGDTWERIS